MEQVDEDSGLPVATTPKMDITTEELAEAGRYVMEIAWSDEEATSSCVCRKLRA